MGVGKYNNGQWGPHCDDSGNESFRVPATREGLRYDTRYDIHFFEVLGVHDPESRGGERVLLAVTTPSALNFYVLSNALLISVALTVHKAAQRLVWALAVVADAHDFEQHALYQMTLVIETRLRCFVSDVSRRGAGPPRALWCRAAH